jgi:hypothetical protein
MEHGIVSGYGYRVPGEVEPGCMVLEPSKTYSHTVEKNDKPVYRLIRTMYVY